MPVSSMEKGEDAILKDWKKKRRYFFIGAIFHKIIFAFEYVSIGISALYYYKHCYNVDNPGFFYSLVIAIMQLTAGISSTLIGKYMDKTRNLRRILSICVIAGLVGNILYVLPMSPWLPVVGRALVGIADGLQPAFGGEISRSYAKEELKKTLAILPVVSVLCYAIAPSSPALFTLVDFRIFGLHINQYNFIGIFMFFVILCYGTFAFFAISNITLHPGYHIFMKLHKSGIEDEPTYTEEAKSDDELLEPIVNESNAHKDTNSVENKKLSLKNTFLNLNLVTILFAHVLINILFSQSELVINMVAINYFKWELTKLSVFALVCSLMSIVLMTYICRLDGITNVYYLNILTFVGMCIVMNLTTISVNENFDNSTKQMLVLALPMCLNLMCGGLSSYFARYLLFHLVSEESRSSVDGYRYTLQRFGLCFGFFTASTIYSLGIGFFFGPSTLVCLGFILTFCIRKRFFFNVSTWEK